MNALPPNEFPDIAVALHLASRDFPKLSFAATLESLCDTERRKRLELLAASIGLDESTAVGVLIQYEERATLIAQAAKLFRDLIPHEAEVRAMLARAAPERAA